MTKYITIHLSFFVSAFALLLLQEIDKFNLFREIVNLKRHMMKIHKWSELKASTARGNLGYDKKRKLLSPSKRRTKPRIYKRQQCPMTGCFKEPLRLRNYLRQTHEIIDKSALNEVMQRAVKSLEDGQFMSESEYSSSVDETDTEDV